MKTRAFLEAVWPKDGCFCIAYPWTPPGSPKPVYRHHIVDTIDEAMQFVNLKKQQLDLFFAIHTLKQKSVWNPDKLNAKTGQKGAKEYRTHANMKEGKAFFFDLDVGTKEKDYATRDEALSSLQRFLFWTGLPDPLVTSSGGGYHVYWRISMPIASDKWRRHATRLHWIARKHGLKADPLRTNDQSSVLRILGTSNFKDRLNPRPVVLVNEGVETPTKKFLAQLKDLVGDDDISSDISQPRSGGTMPSNMEKVWDGAVVTLNDVLAVCEHARDHVLYSHKAPEPEWYHVCMGIFQFVEDGKNLVFKISSEYPGSSTVATQAKLDQYNAKATGPSSCETIDSKCGGVACSRCPFSQLGSNPLSIAHKAKQHQPAPPPVINLTPTPAQVPSSPPPGILLEPPDPYKRVTGGIEMVFPNSKGKMVTRIISPYDMFPYEAYDSNDADGAFSLWAVNLPLVGQRIMRVSTTELHDLRALHPHLIDAGLYIDKSYILKVQGFMIAYVRELRKFQQANPQYDRLGWNREHTRFVMPGYYLDANGKRQSCTLGENAQSVGAFVDSAGTLTAQVKAMEFYNSEEYAAQQFMIMCSLGAPLFYATNQNGMIIHATGETSSSKSTALFAAASMWGVPKLFAIDGTKDGSTRNARNDRMNTLGSLPFCVDELTNMTPEDVKPMVMAMGQGQGGKLRLSSHSKQIALKGGIRASLMLSTGNDSLHALLQINNTASLAGTLRVFEMVCPPIPEYSKRKAAADEFIQTIEDNYGHIGPALMAIEMPIREQLVIEVRSLIKELDAKLQMKVQERFYTANMSVALIAGRLAFKHGLLPFDTKMVMKWLVQKQLPMSRGSIKDEAEANSPTTFLMNYLEAVNGDLIRTNDDPRGDPGNVLYIPNREIKGHFDAWLKRVYIRKDAWKDYCDKRSKVASREIEKLRGLGIVWAGDERVTLGRGTSVGKGRTWCYVVDLTHPSIASLDLKPPEVPAAPNVVPLRKPKVLP